MESPVDPGFLLFAGPIAAPTLHQIEVKMVGMFAVIAGAKYRGEVIAGIGTNAVEQAFFAKGEEARFANGYAFTVVQHNFGHVDGIATRMLGHLCATAVIHRPA